MRQLPVQGSRISQRTHRLLPSGNWQHQRPRGQPSWDGVTLWSVMPDAGIPAAPCGKIPTLGIDVIGIVRARADLRAENDSGPCDCSTDLECGRSFMAELLVSEVNDATDTLPPPTERPTLVDPGNLGARGAWFRAPTSDRYRQQCRSKHSTCARRSLGYRRRHIRWQNSTCCWGMILEAGPSDADLPESGARSIGPSADRYPQCLCATGNFIARTSW